MKNLNFKNLFLLLLLSITFEPKASANSELVHEPAKVYAPKVMAPGKTYPLVLLLHGYSASQRFMELWTGYNKEVDKREFVLVVPNGLKNKNGQRYWNASPACCDFEHKNNDDVGYLKSLIANAIAKYPIDRTRIFVVGHSNGAFMAHTLACEYSEVVTGIISFAGQLAPAKPCTYKRAVTALQIHAVDDKTIHIGGVLQGYDGLTAYPSTEKTMQTVLQQNSCKPLIDSGEVFDIASLIHGPDTNRFVASGCAESVAVEFWKIKAYKSLLHSAHVPFLRDEFTNRTLDFIFAHPRSLISLSAAAKL